MSKKHGKKHKQTATPAQELDSKRNTLRIIPVDIDADWQAPEGYRMQELLHTVIDDEVQFFAVVVKPRAIDKNATPKNPPINDPNHPLSAINLPKPKRGILSRLRGK